MAVATPMKFTASGAAQLLFKAMQAREELAHPFEFQVEALDPDGGLKPEDFLGKPACAAIALPDGAWRHFHGLVSAIETGGRAGRSFQYKFFLRPWLWLLTRRSDTRVFQGLSAQDILRRVFDPFSPDYEFQLTAALPKYDYCVQYRESDFDFVSRLMEQEGIYYYFKHTDSKHTMVLVDAPSAHAPYPSFEKFRFREQADRHLDHEPITEWRSHREIQSGQVVLRDYDFTAPKALLEVKSKAARADASSKLEVYDYPGSYTSSRMSEGMRYSKLRVEELQARYVRCEGYGALRGLACGHRFELLDHPRADQNQPHLVVSTHYDIAYGGHNSGPEQTWCRCHFTAIPGNEVFRPERRTPKPSVSGLHTALVVGPPGQEIHTDEHGRVKVQFHWDRLGKKDDKSSCWVRVSSPLAGQNWGAISLPRIGQEVVVDFLGGDPDRPLITGRVHNAEQPPPYTLPDHATVSTTKSRSSKEGLAANFNELRFEDDKGAEYVWFQAERDFHQFVKNDATLVVKGKVDRIVRKDLTEQIDGRAIGKIGKDWVLDVGGKSSLKVAQDTILESGASVSLKSATRTDIKAGADLAVDASGNVHIKAGASLVIEAGAMVTIKAGPSSVVIGPAGVSIVGPMVRVNSGGSAGAGVGISPKPALPIEAPVDAKDPLA